MAVGDYFVPYFFFGNDVIDWKNPVYLVNYFLKYLDFRIGWSVVSYDDDLTKNDF